MTFQLVKQSGYSMRMKTLDCVQCAKRFQFRNAILFKSLTFLGEGDLFNKITNKIIVCPAFRLEERRILQCDVLGNFWNCGTFNRKWSLASLKSSFMPFEENKLPDQLLLWVAPWAASIRRPTEWQWEFQLEIIPAHYMSECNSQNFKLVKMLAKLMTTDRVVLWSAQYFRCFRRAQSYLIVFRRPATLYKLLLILHSALWTLQDCVVYSAQTLTLRPGVWNSESGSQTPV